MTIRNITFELKGVSDLMNALKLTNTRTRERTIAAIANSTKAVAAKARARVKRRTGELASTIRDEYSRDQLTGYVKAGFGKLIRRSGAKTQKGRDRAVARRAKNRARLASAKSSRGALRALDLGVYAPVVEHGDQRRHHKKQPFLRVALLEEKPAIIERLENAGKDAIADGGF